ncbi:hypothetical protein SRM_00892 [Salinibacter ruber M8]|uniref:Uncharacterized protein n=1 Tax=Salinibacter ruber (strain M8) TaxID=761659 RepID=D5H708_SALRM|nr:hypothetical protein SRM_00892 [Salinibacter ruber M8]
MDGLFLWSNGVGTTKCAPRSADTKGAGTTKIDFIYFNTRVIGHDAGVLNSVFRASGGERRTAPVPAVDVKNSETGT